MYMPRTQNIAGSSPTRGSSSFSLGKKELSSGVVACICLVFITDYTYMYSIGPNGREHPHIVYKTVWGLHYVYSSHFNVYTIYTRTHICVCACVHARVCVCVHACVHAYMYIYMFTLHTSAEKHWYANINCFLITEGTPPYCFSSRCE